jgi:hypothetical protein
MSDELVAQPAGVPVVKPKKPRKVQEYIYLCSSELQKLACGVEFPSPDKCRLGCPFFQRRKPGQGLKLERYVALEKRLINFGEERCRIIEFWDNKERQFKAEGLRNDAYIMFHICEIIREANPKLASKMLTGCIRRCKAPLFRDYYKRARDDISRLRKIQNDHEKAERMRLKAIARLEAANALRELERGILPGKETDGVLPTEPGTSEGVAGTVEGIPAQEVINH